MRNSARMINQDTRKSAENGLLKDLRQSPLSAFSCSNVDIILSNNINTIEPVWQFLQEECPITIYQHYLWQKAWLETIGAAKGGKPLFITGSIEKRPVFLIPLMILHQKHLTIATWIGDDHANYRFGLFSPHYEQSIQAIIEELIAQLPEHLPYDLDVIDLPQQPTAWNNHINPLSVLPGGDSALSGGFIELDREFDAVLKRGNAKRKRKILRSQERSLETFGGYQMIRTSNEDEHNALYDIFVMQKKAWFAERGIKDKFSNAETKAFFNRLAAYNSNMKDGEALLEFDTVFVDGEHIALLAGGTLDGQHFGYFTSMTKDEKYTSLSPGSLTFYKRIEQGCLEGLRRFDFGVGAERYKTSWCCDTVPLIDVFIPLTTRGKIYGEVRQLMSATKRFIKHNETLWSLVKSARRILAGRKL